MSKGYRSYSSRPQRGRKEVRKIIFPFLFIVAGCLILILLYQFVTVWFDQSTPLLADKMHVTVESGSAKVLPWGEEKWIGLYDDSSVLEGDSIELSAQGTAIIALSDGSAFRFGEGAHFLIKSKSEEGIEIAMKNGRAWYFPSNTKTVSSVKVNGALSHVLTSNDSEFEFTTLGEDAVRVFVGSATFNAGKNDSVIESYTVGVGQEIILTDADLTVLASGKRPNLLKGISDSFRKRDWYTLNTSKDPRIAFITDADSNQDTSDSTDVNTDSIPADTASTPDVADASDTVSTTDTPEASPTPTASPKTSLKNIPTPVIDSPVNGFNTSDLQVTLSGTVAPDIAKVRVDHIYNGKTGFSVDLGKYKPGEGSWKYNAVGGSKSNMREGKNTYEVVAIDADGNESEKARLVINYYPNGIPEDASSPTPAPNTPAPAVTSVPAVEDTSVVQPAATSESTPSPTPNVSYKLSAPEVVSFNGSSEPITTENNVKVVGSVDPSSVRVFVNGFALTGYRGGERNWVYYAAEKYDTLTDGVNSYRVYSVDDEGNKSAITQFSITKQAS